MRSWNFKRKTTKSGRRPNARVSIVSPLRTPSESCSCAEVFLRHPRSAQRSACRVVNSFGLKTDRRAALSTFKRFSMIIGAPMSTNSRYRVGHDHPVARLYLIAKRRGYYSRRKAPPVSLVSRFTIFCEHYCSSLCKCTSQSPNFSQRRNPFARCSINSRNC